MGDPIRGQGAEPAAGEAGLPPSEGAPGWGDEVTRREWLVRLGASLALAGVGGCARDRRHQILPYTVAPPEVTPGVPRFYATSLALDGHATGVLVESHEGRPTKIEGNPEHPASLGATTAFEQAAVLGLYDPSRARAPRSRGPAATWDAFIERHGRDRTDGGAGLRLLLEPTGSPLIGALLDRIHARFPAARVTFHAPGRPPGPAEGARLAFGEVVQPIYALQKADVVLSLDADFLAAGPFAVRHARDFAARRRIAAPGDAMSRLYVAEAMLGPTGSLADHRLPRRPSEVPILAAAVAAELVLGLGRTAAAMPPSLGAALAPFRGRDEPRVVQALARDLGRSAGASAVLAGSGQPAVTHALAHLLNALLGNRRTAWAIAPTDVAPAMPVQDLGALAVELARGQVDTLVILEGNPVYTAPADLGFEELLRRVPDAVHLSLHEDETSARCGWFVPAAHALESWGDARAYDGTVSLVQPLITPLHGGRTPAEVLAVLAGERFPDARQLLRASWAERRPGDGFDAFWDESLRRGFVAGTASPPVTPALRFDALASALAGLPPPRAEGGPYEVQFALSPALHDGRFAGNAWLQELPQPTTKLTWDNAVMLGPADASSLGAATGDWLELTLGSRSVRGPALVVPGHAAGAVTLHLGYGRTGAGEALARGVGFDAYRLRTSQALTAAGGLWIRRLDQPPARLARTQQHWSADGRPIVPAATLAEYRQSPGFARPAARSLSLYPDPPMERRAGEQWAMSIDLSICTGCSACVTACQAENNVPVVGKESVLRGREMHWLRIDTYLEGPAEAPEVLHEPMLCQHCEKAPCEYVCPVNATVHSPDGLNEMVYNRCVGTRFCSNNCPYKVRRFNWFDWNERAPNEGEVALGRNPDVTVRERGVMEKCTFCVQRIRGTEIRARNERRAIQPGEVVTACQQACPTGAIQFDSLTHPNSAMARWRAEPRSFQVLEELGTRPRVAYLARIKNPNPELG